MADAENVVLWSTHVPRGRHERSKCMADEWPTQNVFEKRMNISIFKKYGRS